jgi:putative transposase
MRTQSGDHSVRALCRALGVSASGYYAWRNRKPSARELENRRLARVLLHVHVDLREACGAEKLWHELRHRGERCGRHRVARLRRRQGIVTKRRRRLIRARKPYDRLPPAPRMVRWPFKAQGPNRVWAGDITFIPTARGWLYLAVVIDHYTRLIVGWSMSSRPDQVLTIAALQMSLARQRPRLGLIFHSDQGSQYTSSEFKAALQSAGAVQSMSRPGMPYDNAIVESFFSSLKNELVHHERFRDQDHARAKVFDYIEGFYSRKRRHQSLGYMTPHEVAMQGVL